jgi:hypothetical protein
MNVGQLRIEPYNSMKFECLNGVEYLHCSWHYPNPSSSLFIQTIHQHYISPDPTSTLMPMLFPISIPFPSSSHHLPSPVAELCSFSPHNPEPDLRSLLTRRVPAHVGLVDEETPHGVEYCEDDHGEELEEGEDVGSTPHVSRGMGEVAVCGRCIDKWFSAKQDEGLLLLILWLRGCTEERMCLL